MQHKIRKTYFKTQLNYVYFNYFTTLNVGAPTSWSEERNRPQNLPELMSRIWSTADCPDKHDNVNKAPPPIRNFSQPVKTSSFAFLTHVAVRQALVQRKILLLSLKLLCDWTYVPERERQDCGTEAQIRSMAHHRSLLLTVYVYVGYKCHLSATNVAKCE